MFAQILTNLLKRLVLSVLISNKKILIFSTKIFANIAEYNIEKNISVSNNNFL